MTEGERNRRLVTQEAVQKIAQQSVSELIREELGKDLNFVSAVNVIEAYIDLFKNLSLCDFEKIPKQFIDHINSHAQQANALFSQIKSFSLQTNPRNPIVSRDQYIQSLHEQYYAAFDEFSDVVNYFKPTLSISSYDSEIKNLLNDLNKEKESIENSKVAILAELNQILETARQTSSQIGVATHAVHFKDEAADHLAQSKKWLYALGVISTITVLWGVICFFINPESDKSHDILQFTIAKLIVISGLYFALSVANKNYKAHRHNYIVNKHKQNSLSSFESFVKGAGDDMQTKNAVLITATQSIFSNQTSGYTSNESDPEPSKIIEILKTTNAAK